MRERTTWSREIIASKLRKVAEDPRSMNQDHIQRQPAADDYLIGDGSPSQFAEDVNSGKGSWKSEQGSDGQTKRNEIGLPEFRGDTFNNPESSPGVSPSRQASLSVDEIHERATLATEAARLMLPRTASARAIEDQALLLMDMPSSSLKSTLSRLAQQDEGDDDDDADDDDGEGQDKQAQQDDDEDDDGQQAKQAKDLPPEFLKNIQKKKDEAKDDKGEKDDKSEKKEARSRRAQDQDEKKQSQQQDKEEGKEQQGKEARARKAQQQAQDEDEGQDKEAADQDEKKQSQQQDKDKEACDIGKEAAALIKQAAAGLLSVPQTARQAAFKAMLPMLMKSASEGLGQPVAQQQQLSQQQLQSQVQQLVQQAMQQQLADQQQQQVAQGQQQVAQGQQQLPQLAQGQEQLPQLAQDDSQALVDQLFQEPDQGQQFFASDEIQMESPTMDIGDISFGPEDAALNTLFASEPEVQRAIQANALRSGTATPAPTRTASTRTVGTRPTEGVSHLGGAVSSTPGGSSDEINRLSGMWSTAPDVSGVFSS